MRPVLLLALAFASTALAQTPAQPEPQPPADATTTLTSQSNLVLVPALVRDKKGQLIFSLKVNDFVLTDDGVPQKLHLEEDTGSEPLALVVCIEGGGAGVDQLQKYAALESMLDAVVGAVPHRIAVVGFDSSPVVVQDFTSDTTKAEQAVHALIADNNGDDKAAILDSLNFSVDMLRKQPIQYRRAILLVSETLDRGSKTTLDEAVRAISDTNTAIYSIGFSTTKSESRGDAAKLSSSDPGPAHGCFSRDPNDPNVDRSKSAAQQSFDCVAMLAPPLRLAHIGYVAIRDAIQHNVPESVAKLTGGEYYKLGSENTFERDLSTIANHIPNRYILSFQPQSPHAGFHAISLMAPEYKGLLVYARTGYWIDEPAPANQPKP
ncbi:MAG TPA: VWA domain-containing protein [Chloroflexota bacterium]